MTHAFVEWCCELLAPLGDVRARRMFGSHGLYVDDLFIAIVSGDTLYLKVDETTKPLFLATGSRRFEFVTAKGDSGGLNYFSAPEAAMDSPAQLQPWARLAMDSALRARTSKTAAVRRNPPSPQRAIADRTPGKPRGTEG